MYRITIYDDEFVIKGDEIKKVTTKHKFSCPTIDDFQQFVGMMVLFSNKELNCTIGKMEEENND